jgi:hypothetical protein
MELGKLAGSVPATDEIMRALGLQQRRQGGTEIVGSLALFGAGLLVGAGLALLLAPTSGRELREEITDRASELRDRVSAATSDELEDGD